jgi:hypothetical protein
MGMLALLVQPMRAATLTWGECAPLLQFHAGIVTCYRAVHEAAAERRLPVRPVSPVRPAAQVFHLTLRQVLLLSGTPDGRPGPGHAIFYVFGMTRVPACDAHQRCPAGSVYVIVQETVCRIARTRPRLTYSPGFVPGPWHLDASLPLRHLCLDITSNTVAPRLVQTLGQRIIHTA